MKIDEFLHTKTHELLHISIIILILAFAVSFMKSFSTYLISILFFLIIFAVYIAAKKWTAWYYQAEVETKTWQFQRYGWYERSYLKTPIPIGIFLPFLISILSLGNFYWLAATQSEITARKSRVIKAHDFYSFSELTEFHIGMIPAMGIFACLLLGFLAYLLNLGALGKLAIFFACFNMLPIGNLDGTKVFFGSPRLWFLLAAICFIALGYAILLI
jgi:hypothetical protein